MVLGAAFDIPGVVVDTHVARISARLGLTAHTDPEKIETDLMAVIPRKEWSDFSLRLIFFGREICAARKPKCPILPRQRPLPVPRQDPLSSKIASQAERALCDAHMVRIRPELSPMPLSCSRFSSKLYRFCNYKLFIV